MQTPLGRLSMMDKCGMLGIQAAGRHQLCSASAEYRHPRDQARLRCRSRATHCQLQEPCDTVQMRYESRCFLRRHLSRHQ